MSEDGKWITINHQHVFIPTGKTLSDVRPDLVGMSNDDENEAETFDSSNNEDFYETYYVNGQRVNKNYYESHYEEWHNDARFERKLESLPEFAKQFKRLNKPETIEEAAQSVNPKYWLTNNSYEYSYNCQRCVIAYLVRKLFGLDVSARPRLKDDEEYIFSSDRHWMNSLKGMEWKNWTYRSAYHHRTTNGRIYNEPGDYKRTAVEALKEAGPGSIFVFTCTWMGVDESGRHPGHTFIGENDNGEIRFIDPQTNNTNYKPWSRIMRSNDYTRGNNTYVTFAYRRVDLLDLAENMIYCCEDSDHKQIEEAVELKKKNKEEQKIKSKTSKIVIKLFDDE